MLKVVLSNQMTASVLQHPIPGKPHLCKECKGGSRTPVFAGSKDSFGFDLLAVL
jgi:hypothetical protein